uniref:cysteine-rich protein 2-binding protein isoform X2 n=1 Tax=Ciona intestinalis TaxID=7719 RepID=UPI00089DD2A1|nr:cysteine-rich protein 2-binding protein isoform X2 [Ciona intestinalis]|eukprot:XP_018668552.1 cysteine-rich protein 2-binding protein isoform X2 [Ciona intestinalis]
MSEVEQVDVDVTSTEDSAEKDKNLSKCAYCECAKDGILAFHCDGCKSWVHSNCLHSGPPNSVLGDNYFTFMCSSCNGGKETYTRMKVTWIQVVSLSLYNLAQTSMGKQGFFKWKEDICLFIDKHWDSFFGESKKKTNQWTCTVGSVLSAGNPIRFQSGHGIFKDSGWWRLVDPTQAPEYVPGAVIINTPKYKPRRLPFGSGRSGSRRRSHMVHARNARLKKAALIQEANLSEEKSPIDSPVSNVSNVSNIAQDSPRPSSPSSSISSLDFKTQHTKEAKIDPTLPLNAISDESDTEDILHQRGGEGGVGGDGHRTAMEDTSSSVASVPPSIKPNVTKSMFLPEKRETKPIVAAEEDDKPKIRMMNLYEERKLVKKLLHHSKVEDDVDGRRLRRKLLLRQKKRQLGLSVFNFDDTVRRLLSREQNLIIPTSDGPKYNPVVQRGEHRVLDRFLSSDPKLYGADESRRTFKQKLVGSNELTSEQQLIVSPYTQRILKPFIRRDFETKPPKLKVLIEIVENYHKSDTTWQADVASPIDYCYVRPRHIPTINALCRHFFWPGIDLSESLQYPDFSVVALYKKMVVGFGFLVPDVSFNQAYISFLLVHPDWQHAGIGTFMLYHLMQTCMGKDVTLHVSASNPAMLLYQRFGFKPERFEADFYDKYLPPDDRECAHAFFMRLRR